MSSSRSAAAPGLVSPSPASSKTTAVHRIEIRMLRLMSHSIPWNVCASSCDGGSGGGAHVDRRPAQDLERSVLEDVEVRMGGPVPGERRDLLVLQPLDLGAKRAKERTDEAHKSRGADMLARMKASDVPAEVRGARGGVPDRPQVQGEERLRPAVGPERDRDEMGRAVREQAHRVEVARLVVGSVAVVVELTARSTGAKSGRPGLEA